MNVLAVPALSFQFFVAGFACAQEAAVPQVTARLSQDGRLIEAEWTFTDSAPTDWCGLYRAEPLDSPIHYWDYRYGGAQPGQTSGRCTFHAPSTPGSYVVRYCLRGGYECPSASAPVAVVADPAPPTAGYGLTVQVVSVGVDQPIAVSWAAPSSRTIGGDWAWIGAYEYEADAARLSKADAQHIVYRYLGPGASGTATFTELSSRAGVRYEFRLFADGGYTQRAAVAGPVMVVGPATQAANSGHPFLLVQEADYAALQARANGEPWRSWKADAIATINTLAYDPLLPIADRAHRMREIASAGALAYILDPANRAAYAQKLYDALSQWDSVTSALSNWSWGGHVPPSWAFFNSVLALDIIYDDLAIAQRQLLEAKLAAAGTWFRAQGILALLSHPEAIYSAAAMWGLYTQDRAVINEYKARYRSFLEERFADSGVYKEGANYGQDRMAGFNDAKAYLIDVLEHTGEDRYYTDPRFQRGMEWLFSGAVNPLGLYQSYSDSRFTKRQGGSARHYSAARFSQHAGRSAAWLLELNGHVAQGRLLPYVLHDGTLPAPQPPTSHIFGADGMASFWQDGASTRALHGALWNLTSSPPGIDNHLHKEVNAITLSSHGANLLVNAGYNGWGNGAVGNNWTYLHDQAVSGNTMLLNGADHRSKLGGGIVDGFVSDFLDYARGDSGQAISGGVHQRDFVLAHPQDGAAGYAIVFDEMAAPAGSQANLVLHPYGDVVRTVTDRQEYEWDIRNAPVILAAFLATPPETVELRTGALASDEDSLAGRYLYASYRLGAAARKSIVTVLAPRSATLGAPSFIQEIGVSLAGQGYSGARIVSGDGVADVALGSLADAQMSHGSVSFLAHAVWYRRVHGRLTAYFVRGARRFYDAAGGQGVESDAEISLHLREGRGRLSAPAQTTVRFFHPGITGVRIDGQLVTSPTSGAGGAAVGVSAGVHEVELVTQDPMPSPTLSLAASPASVPNQGMATLKWEVRHAASCEAANAQGLSAWQGPKDAADGLHAQSIGPLTSTTDFSLVCRGLSGSVAASTTVTVESPPQLPVITLAASDARAGEGGDAGLFRLSRTGNVGASLTVHVARSGSALAGPDFRLSIGNPGGPDVTGAQALTFPATVPVVEVYVIAVDDQAVESEETVTLALTEGSAYTVGDPSAATVTLQDNDQAPPTNTAPLVSAGPDQATVFPIPVRLKGAVRDATPTGTLTTVWTKISGPGAVTFANPRATGTVAVFGAAGTYILRLTASDGQLSAGDDVRVTVRRFRWRWF